MPNTRCVHAEFVSGLPAVQPGNRFTPRKYWVPSVVVTFQYSPSLSPLTAPLCRSTRAPSSFFARQVVMPVAASSPALTSLPETPARLIVALSVAQHASPVFS
ncbi:hypothetical protein [Lentzea pudingi]|uniref:hypothetical protein n=1 Tax=Lentzea pudingi TaxID=1789439 RepID=UPI00166B3BEB|nr:hypothetical protein [Lentzea pudingi]